MLQPESSFKPLSRAGAAIVLVLILVSGFVSLGPGRASIREGLSSPDPEVRRRGLEALGRIRRQDEAAAVTPLLHDHDDSVKKAAVRTLEILKPVEAVPELAGAALDPTIGMKAISILGELEHPAGLAALDPLTNSSDPAVAAKARKAQKELRESLERWRSIYEPGRSILRAAEPCLK